MTDSDLANRLTDETTLSEKESEVVAMRIEGTPYREIADELGISHGAANSYWQRAKEKAATAERSAELFREIGLVE